MSPSGNDLLNQKASHLDTSSGVEEHIADFLYFSDRASEVRFVADSTDWIPMSMERQGHLWCLKKSYPMDGRDEYLLVVDGEYVLDPLNPVQLPGVFGPRSECAMPLYRQPLPITNPRDGLMEHIVIQGREVEVYVPAQLTGAALLVVQDGSDYIRLTGMPGLLDTLIRQQIIPPVVAVFIDPQHRDTEYRPNERYITWLADFLVPALVRRYGINAHPGCHGLVGASLGGLISTYTVLRRPDAFALIGAQSPAYRIAPDLRQTVRSMRDEDRRALRIHVDGGTLETVLHRRPYLPAIRAGARLFEAQDCAVQYNEVNEGHNWKNWRGRLPDLLQWLLRPTS